ncbi:MFS transporter [Nocardia stercoris]|uniref:MFS transporter n=1 Tax=Nocardia stercoris TaxID=2483361 RepID=A0A3M2KVI5_9NOCA|nr:MFS transporter [Nocardia stercoris]RMI29479.1 MFS transporter [Nocardia stercoris]
MSTPSTPTIVDDTDTGRLDGASRLRIFSVLAVIVLFTEVAPLQYTMIAAALQKIAPSFPQVGANITWAIIVFGLVGAAASPLVGKISDVWGKKRTFLLCGLIFLIGCVIDATTNNWGMFLFGRALQAIAIATQVVAYGLIRDLLPRKYVPLGLGVTATGLGFSALLAPIVGGWLLEHHSYHAIFWFLAAFMLVMTPFVIVVVPESKLRVKESVDIVGAALLAAGVTLTLIYLDKGQDWGWSKLGTLVWLFGGLALLVVFVVVENIVSTPIMDMKLLFTPRVGMVLVLALFASFIIGIQGYATGYMTQTPDAANIKATIVDQAQAGVAAMTGHPIPASMIRVTLDPEFTYGSGFSLLQYAWHIAVATALAAMIVGAIGGALTRRTGARLPLIVGLLIFTAIGAIYAVAPYSVPSYLLLGIAFGTALGLYYATAPNLIVEAVPQEQQGISVGMLGVMNSMGTAIGLAVVTAFVNSNPVQATVEVMGTKRTVPVPSVFGDHGYALGYWFAAGGSAVALVFALVMRHGRTPATGGTAH